MSRIYSICPCGCGVTVPQGQRCAASKRRDNQRRNAKSRAHGLKTFRWQQFRRARLSRYPDCELGLDGCTITATTVHLDPELQGDHSRASYFNTKSACAQCHGAVDGARAHG